MSGTQRSTTGKLNITKKQILSDFLLGNISPDDKALVLPNITGYLLTLINISYSGTDYKNEGEETEAAHALLTEIIETTTKKMDIKTLSTTVRGNPCYIFILGTKDSIIKMQLFLEHAMRNMTEFFKKFYFDVIFSTSNSHQGANTFPDAYRESLDMLAHAQKSATSGLYYYMDVKEEHKTSYFYPPEKEQNIISLLKIGDYDGITEEFNEIYSRNFDNIFASLEMVRCLYIDMLGTILKTCRSGIDGELNLSVESDSVVRLLLNCTDISVMTNAILNLFKNCCDEIKLHNSGIEDKFIADVEKYISEHYSNMNLNVASIAEVFLVHPNYLSKIFKKQMQMNMLTYVNYIRVKKAKKLLTDTDLSLEDICAKTGFGSYRTFIRVFRQIVSISPGRYRSLTEHK